MSEKAAELNVKVNVDIAETIRGLKAIQREAKKATQALRDLESADTGGVFKTNDVLTWEGVEHRVVIADAYTAILAPVAGHTDEQGYVKSTDMTRLFAISNVPALITAVSDRVARL